MITKGIRTKEISVAVLDQTPHISVAEYLRGLADGVDQQNSELVRGVVYAVSPEHMLHSKTVMCVSKKLAAALTDHDVFCTGSVQLNDWSLVDPDVFVVVGADQIPDDAPVSASAVPLVVEVSVSSLHHDLGVKLQAYAEAGIPELWVIEPTAGAEYLLRHTDPDGERYRGVTRVAVGRYAADLDVASLIDPA